MKMKANLCKRDGGGGDDNDDGDIGGVSLPEDIILEVLLRLPAKSLLRFQCVCRSWRALITDPSFAAAQRSRATGPLIVAMFGSGRPEQELRLLDKGGNVLRVLDAFRGGGKASVAPAARLGLVLVDRAELGATIVDPATGRAFTVVGGTNDHDHPDHPPPPAWWGAPTAVPSSDYSFGHASASGDYKVLRLVTLSCSRRWCEVATIMDVDVDMDARAEPTWRRKPWGPFFDSTFSCQDKATVNGVVYFLPYKSYSRYHARDRIAAFDLESEEWKPEMIKCPPLERKQEDAWGIALTELKGTLCVVQNILHLISSFGGHYVHIWLLMDPNKSIWVKEYRIHVPGRFLLSTKPFDVSGDGTVLLLLNASWKARNVRRYILQLYNYSTKDFTDFMEMPDGFNGTMTFYTGSLLSYNK